MNWLLLAGGIIFTPSPSTPAQPEVDLKNHTLAGEVVMAKEVVTRNRWGTPMMPNNVSGYSIIQPIVPALITQSLIQPPKTTAPIFRPQSK